MCHPILALLPPCLDFLLYPPGSQTEECPGCPWTVALSVGHSPSWGCTPSSGVQFLHGTVQSSCVGSPPYTDQTVSSSMADASIVTDAHRLGHPAVKVLAQTSPLNVQSGLSKVLHEGLSCAAMGPPEKGEGTRWVSETNATKICMARQCSGRPRTATSPGTTQFKELYPPQQITLQ